MGLRKSKGNMYPWVTHTHAALGGRCPHECSYCYVEHPRFGRAPKYDGDVRLIQSEMETNLGTGRTIFKENCNDLFAVGVPDHFIRRIIEHCRLYPGNIYVFQTKNPVRITEDNFPIPPGSYVGTTIETNRDMTAISKAPAPEHRFHGIGLVRAVKKFITIEPILDFDVPIMLRWMKTISPSFVNIGADSKKRKLPEPPAEKVRQLVAGLQEANIEIREKHNLDRILR